METVEQNDIRTEYYNEAIRYMDNAKETLKKSRQGGGYLPG